MLGVLLLPFVVTALGAAGSGPIVVHVVADDLGRDDLGFMNGNKTHTPHINERVQQGIFLTHYHTYKVCSPSRASIMTGRYPWGVGYYDMVGPLQVPLDFTMMPALLAANGWSTHALGKWNLGNDVKAFTPTFRGFSTFFGYYAAALADYWWHGSPSKARCNLTIPFCTDLSNSSGLLDPDGVMPASPSVNGTYDQELFSAEAVRLIEQAAAEASHSASTSTRTRTRTGTRTGSSTGGRAGTYIYLAYQNVHTTSQNPATLSGSQPFQAPCATVDELYSTTAEDCYKVLGAMVTELDYGVGNVTAALQASGLDWVMILTADNGGLY